jgi:hypothetical protein
MLQDNNASNIQAIQDFRCDGGFSRACSARYSDYQRMLHVI